VLREVPFVAFPQLGKFLQGGELAPILEPKVDRELAGGFVEASVTGSGEASATASMRGGKRESSRSSETSGDGFMRWALPV
jgi:hypothetical protein